MLAKFIQFCLLVSALASMLSVSAYADTDDFMFTKIVDTETPIPNGSGNFTRFSQPSLDEGYLAFSGTGKNQRGIYTYSDGELFSVADLKTLIPDGVGTFSNVGSPSLHGGNVAFWGTGKNGQTGIYLYKDGLLSTVIDQNTVIPGGVGTFTDVQNPSLDGDSVAFRGAGEDGQFGIYTYTNNSLIKVSDFSTDIPNSSGTFSNFSEPTTDGDNIAFAGGNSFQQGVYMHSNGALSTIADFSTVIPDGMGNFTGFSEPSLDNGNLAFWGAGSNQQGIYIHRDGFLSRIADLNTLIPSGTGAFTNVGSPTLDGENVAFWGTGSGTQAGIYTNLGVDLTKVVDRNDVLDGEAFSDFGLSNESISDLSFGFGTFRIFLATAQNLGPQSIFLDGAGSSYLQDFDDSLRTAGIGDSLPVGWSTRVDGQTSFTITQDFPPSSIISGTFNVGSETDRTLAIGGPDSSLEQEIQFLAEISNRDVRAVRFSFDLEAWGGYLSADLPGEAAFGVKLISQGPDGLVTLVDLGTQTTGPSLSPGILDGNQDESRTSFDSGVVVVDVKQGTSLGLSFDGQNQGATSGYIFGIDNLVFRTLAPGDTDGDGRIDMNDILRILIADKFGRRTNDASWEEGDFNQDRRVDSLDILALQTSLIGTFPKQFASDLDTSGDSVPEVIVDPTTGSVTIDTNGWELANIVIDSQAGIFNGSNSPDWDSEGLFSSDSDTQISLPINFGRVGFIGVDDLGEGILGDVSADFDFLADLTVSSLSSSGSLLGGRVIVVPEPSSLALAACGFCGLLGILKYRRRFF